MEYDSLYFLSTSNGLLMSNIEIEKATVFKAALQLNFDLCIQHLAETQRMKIIKNDERSKFLEENSNIFYDDDTHKHPQCDVLYRIVNKNYFVKNDEYFEKFTAFYFKLYSTIFSFFGLEKISMVIHNNKSLISNMNIKLDAVIATASVGHNKSKINKEEDSIEMSFDKTLKNLTESFNNTDDKLDFLHNNMPSNLQNTIYEPSIELDLIQKRTIKNMIILKHSKKLENTNIIEVELGLKQTFNLNQNIGLFAKSSKEKMISQDVSFDFRFFPSEILNTSLPSSIVTPKPEPDVINDYNMDFYVSKEAPMSGPWPIHCNEVYVRNSVKSKDEALQIAREQIRVNPPENIIEIVELFVPPFSWTYSVKTFHIKPNTKADVHIGNGRRQVAFDKTLFKYKDNVISTLKGGGYY
jgi:hypothetical protein